MGAAGLGSPPAAIQRMGLGFRCRGVFLAFFDCFYQHEDGTGSQYAKDHIGGNQGILPPRTDLNDLHIGADAVHTSNYTTG